jgi:hypothetical protein
MFYNLVGRAEYTTAEGFVQTFYRYNPSGRFTHYVGQRGRPPGYCNPSAWGDVCDTGTGGERVVPLLQSGWQTALVLSAVAVTAGRDHVERVGR